MAVNAGTDRRLNNQCTLGIERPTDIVGLPFAAFLGQYPDCSQGGRTAGIFFNIESHPHPLLERVGGGLKPTMGIYLNLAGQFERLVVDDQLMALNVEPFDLAVAVRCGEDLAGRGAGCEPGPD